MHFAPKLPIQEILEKAAFAVMFTTAFCHISRAAQATTVPWFFIVSVAKSRVSESIESTELKFNSLKHMLFRTERKRAAKFFNGIYVETKIFTHNVNSFSSDLMDKNN